ncbi:hypothetical protein F5Y18DRAFT_423703 [Xylariaceae sp. FL1019]|nr:hypothetical protein F5Y18DRAFT_423703 [Xylariaceae sp. FL1019]
MNSSVDTADHNRPSRTSPTNTALRGASLAFQKKTSPTTGPTPTRHAGNGALIAATSASRDHSLSRSPSYLQQQASLSRQTTGNSIIQQSHLLTPTRPTVADQRSPSFIAATLAASRSASPNPHVVASTHPYAQQAARRQSKGGGGSMSAASSVTDLDLATDTTSIPPTNALISMFEYHGNKSDPVKKRTPASGSKKPVKTPPPLRSLTPPRALSPTPSIDLSPSRLAAARARAKAPPLPAVSARNVAATQSIAQTDASKRAKTQPPTPPPTRRKAEAVRQEPVSKPSPSPKPKPRAVTPPPRAIGRAATVVLSPQPRRTPSQKIIAETLDHDAPSQVPLSSEVLRRSSTFKAPQSSALPGIPGQGHESHVRRSSSSMSNDAFVSASSSPSSPSPPPAPASRRKSLPPTPDVIRPLKPLPAQNLRSLPARLAVSTRQNTSQITLDSLTDAIMAGSLASARASPIRSTPPTPPPRNPPPHMRKTLRAPRSKSDDEDPESKPQYKKKPLGKLSSRKKHSHHEGSRKRWRDEITTRERKRYEGVWASNRGLLLEYCPDLSGLDKSQLVVNVVVRDLWSRSRLPFDELAEVWNLVDRQRKGYLNKAEFVVGMWLIDQRLRGRKLPHKVSESVWGSVRGMSVISPTSKR